jgi:hypothetical protein
VEFQVADLQFEVLGCRRERRGANREGAQIWQQRTNVWRKVTSPRKEALRLRSGADNVIPAAGVFSQWPKISALVSAM